MDQKLATTSLVIFIAAIFAFVSTFAWFMLFKEQVCAVNVNSPACGMHFMTFVLQKLGH